MIKGAKKFDIDLKKLYDVAKLGSGNSAALSRIFDNLLKYDYTGFKFTAKNSYKDMSYILELLKDMPDAENLAKDTKDFYKDDIDIGNGELFISELIKK
jgi:3-hydroxyisobutyrate dehydrogenase-like beta-hydroxyacid dehydrogenase